MTVAKVITNSEWRSETCLDCGESRDREWLYRLVGKSTPIPRGWRVANRRGSWKTIEARTRWTTLCLCDAE